MVAEGWDPGRYRTAARQVADWLISVASEELGGVTWLAQPGVSAAAEPSMGWGALGPMVFFADAYRTAGDASSLEMAERGLRWLRAKIGCEGQDMPPGLFTGLAGSAVVFSEMERVGADVTADLARVFELLAGAAERTEAGVNWQETTEVLWGTAGIGFVLLSIGRHVMGDYALELAAQAGDWLLAVAHRTPDGLRWDPGEGPSREYPYLREIWFPNFAHGTAGIAAYLARLGAATSDQRYLDAARLAATWILTTCRTDGDTCAARHHEPSAHPGDIGIGPVRAPDDDAPMYTMGWCHGPPGLGWFFRELHVATGEPIWAEWVARTARGIRRSGIPERREPGFWDNVGRCCGSAGVTEYFLDLHQWRNDPGDLAFAVEIVDDLLQRAIVDDDGMRWSNVEFRADPPDLPPETTFFQGASGIGSTLLRLARQLEGDMSAVWWPHAPDWSQHA